MVIQAATKSVKIHFNNNLPLFQLDTEALSSLLLSPGHADPGEAGAQIWIGRECADGSSRPIPMFRGIFFKNRYPYLGIFMKKGTNFFGHKNTPNFQNFPGFACFVNPLNFENKTHSQGIFFMKNGTHVQRFLTKKPTQNCGTSLYVLTCEYPPHADQAKPSIIINQSVILSTHERYVNKTPHSRLAKQS